MEAAEEFSTYKEFYHFYLREHANPVNRALHFIGTSIVFGIIAASVYLANPWLLFATPVAGYGFAWFGHFAVEKNRPATFKHPGKSLLSDFVMYFSILTGQINKQLKEAGVTVKS